MNLEASVLMRLLLVIVFYSLPSLASATSCHKLFSFSNAINSGVVTRDEKSFDLRNSEGRNNFLREFPKLIKVGDYVIYRFAGHPFSGSELKFVAYKDSDVIDLSAHKDVEGDYSTSAQGVINRSTLVIPAEIWQNEVITRNGKSYRLNNYHELQYYIHSVMTSPQTGDYVVLWESAKWQVVRIVRATEHPSIYVVNDGVREMEINYSAIVAPFIVPHAI